MAPEQPRLTFSQASPAERHGFLSEGPLGSVTVGKVLRLGTPFDQACDGGGGGSGTDHPRQPPELGRSTARWEGGGGVRARQTALVTAVYSERQ